MARNRKYQHASHATTEGFIPTANPAFAAAMHEKGRSSATSRYSAHGLRRQGSRASAKAAAIRDFR